MLNGKNQVRAVILTVFFILPALFPFPAKGASSPLQEIKRLLGSKDAALLAGPSGQVILGVNTGKPLVPASTLKLLTALAAMHYLGEDYRFQTDFYVRNDGPLTIKGFGDPLLVSEEVAGIAAALRRQMNFVQDLVLDDTYFAKPLDIPGISKPSLQPYDAPCGALCINFNSVGFRVQQGQIISPEAQTPMVDIGRTRILYAVAGSSLSSGRIPLSSEKDEIVWYAGQVFGYFLRQEGIRITGGIRMGKADPARDRLVYRHVSPFPLSDIIRQLMKNSNNFVANQLLLASGAAAFGPPATLEKAVLVAKTYSAEVLGMETLRVAEGSGISRDNRLSAAQFLKILQAFKPHYHLLRRHGMEYYKTGTLNGVRARAGYLEGRDGGLYPFVVLINTPGKGVEGVMKQLKRRIPYSDSSS